MNRPEMTPERAAMLKQNFESAPFSRKLGVRADRFEPGRAVFVLDYTEENTTIADVVHGGAILSLVDVAATAAAWTTIENPLAYRGTTADVSLSFIAAGRSQALTADAHIVRQGGSLTFLEATVVNEDNDVVAKALITYKLSKADGR